MDKKFIPLSVPNFGDNEKKYVTDAVVSEWVSTGGSQVAKFEEVFANYVGMSKAVACASGTAALHLACLVAGLGSGNEVIAPALTFIAAVNPICYVGATPVFIGCDDSLCIDATEVESFCVNNCKMQGGVLYNKKTGNAVKAIMAVHVFGNMADMPALCDIAKKYNLTLIEDATEAVGTRYESGPFAGKMAGSMGDIAAYSFNGNKIITTGAGGMLVAQNKEYTKRAKHLSTQAKTSEEFYTHDEVGYNYRMTNLQAALGLAQMEELETFITRKNEMYLRYCEKLHGKFGMRMLPFRQGVRSNRWFFSLYLEDYCKLSRDELMVYLKAENIQTRSIWDLINRQKPYAGCEAYALDKATIYHARVLNLPCSTGLSDEDIGRVCECILRGAANGKT